MGLGVLGIGGRIDGVSGVIEIDSANIIIRGNLPLDVGGTGDVSDRVDRGRGNDALGLGHLLDAGICHGKPGHEHGQRNDHDCEFLHVIPPIMLILSASADPVIEGWLRIFSMTELVH